MAETREEGFVYLRQLITRRTIAGAALLSLTLAGCDVFSPRACDLGIEPAVEVEIVDAESGEPVAQGAKGVIRDGAYVDSLRPYRSRGDGTVLSLGAGDARSGVYRVEVVRDGYAPWQRDGVRARRGDCGLETAHVRAALVPAS